MNSTGILTQIFHRSDVVLYLWILLVVVGLAALAVAARPGLQPAFAWLLVLGFSFFAFTHLLCIQWLLKQWGILATALRETDGWRGANEGVKAEIVKLIDAPDPMWVLPFHLAFDCFVLIGLWWLNRKRGL